MASTPKPRLIGHEEPWRLLTALIDRGRFPAAVLLVGSPGVGKRTFTRALATHLLNTKDPEAHVDTLRIDPQGDLGGREAVSQLLQRVHQHPVNAAVRVIFLDAIDELSPAAAALLLKAIEDAPGFAKFLLTAVSTDRVPATVRSRALVRELHPVPEELLIRHLSDEGVSASRAKTIARLSGGRPGVARRLLADEALVDRYARWEKSVAQTGVSFAERSALAAEIDEQGAGEEFLSFLQGYLRASVTGALGRTVPAAALRRAREGMAMLRQSVPTQPVIEYTLMSLEP